MKTPTSGGNTSRMQLDDLDFADDLTLLSHTQQQMQDSTVLGGNLENYESHHPENTGVYKKLSTQNTSDPLAGHYKQQPTMGENKPDPSGGRNQE
ncbi:unnamed protein product [Schistosoma margrebowiei]|uniref:Uncharacterized protein n=1 Tax=Schistosoma margrebowiei TaxID=48269 RepID=A0A183MF59_9TREM|nr:unnamed protein product [Schistosoma margrebowiei]